MLSDWMWCQLLGKLITWHATQLNPANPVVYHPFGGPTVTIVTPSVSKATARVATARERHFTVAEGGMAEHNGGLIQKKDVGPYFVALNLWVTKAVQRVYVVLPWTIHKVIKTKGGTVEVNVQDLRQKEAWLLLLWYTTGWHYVPSQNVMSGDVGAYSTVSNNKCESFPVVKVCIYL